MATLKELEIAYTETLDLKAQNTLLLQSVVTLMKKVGEGKPGYASLERGMFEINAANMLLQERFNAARQALFEYPRGND